MVVHKMKRIYIFVLAISINTVCKVNANSACVEVEYSENLMLSACLDRTEIREVMKRQWFDGQIERLEKFFFQLLESTIPSIRKKHLAEHTQSDYESILYRIISNQYRETINELYCERIKKWFLKQYNFNVERGLPSQLQSITYSLFSSMALPDKDEFDRSLLSELADELTEDLIKNISKKLAADVLSRVTASD